MLTGGGEKIHNLGRNRRDWGEGEGTHIANTEKRMTYQEEM